MTGITYVPYYLVFDEHGELAYHHQGGPYHGGDGTAVLERVREMIRELPAVYVGKERYVEHQRLAKQVSEGKSLTSALKALATALDRSPEDAELTRLASFVEHHAQRAMRRFEEHASTDSKEALKELTVAAKAYEGTPWGSSLVELADSAKEQKQRYEESSRALVRFLRDFGRLKTKRGNDGAVRNPTDVEFVKANRKELEELRARLEELVEGYGDTPAGRTGKQVLSALE